METTSYKEIARDLVRLALLPAFFAGAGLIFLHWILLLIWLSFNYSTASQTQLIVALIIGGLLPVVLCWIWATRRFLMKAFGILHESLIRKWILEVTNRIAARIVEAGGTTGLFATVNEVVKTLKEAFEVKTQNAPKLIKRLVGYINRKLGFSPDVAEKIKAILAGDPAHLSGSLEAEISKQMYGLYGRILPRWVGYLVVLNLLGLIVLWFF